MAKHRAGGQAPRVGSPMVTRSRTERLDEHLGDGAPHRRAFHFDFMREYVCLEKDWIAWAHTHKEALAYARQVAVAKHGAGTEAQSVL